MQYRPDIDGLRALAVLSVIAFHAFPEAVPYGFVGVDVFFVISGYLITDDIARRLKAGSFALGDFYLRRMRRLFPALVTVLASVAAFGTVVLYPDEREQLARHVFASALFAQNFQLLGEAGYFDTTSSAKPLLHLWSLAIEEQFYLLWPLVLVLRPRPIVVAGLAAMSAVTFAFTPMDIAYYLPVTRFWEILAGALLALTYGFPRLPLSNPALVYVGLLSYPLYLWHWPILSFLRISAPQPSTLALLAAIGASFVLAAATYHWIEYPLRTRGALVTRTRWLAASMVTVVAVSFATTLMPESDGHAQRLADIAAKPSRDHLKPCALPGGLCLQEEDASFALVGDSHADHLFDALARDGDWLLSYRQSCPPLTGVVVKFGRGTCASDELVRQVGKLDKIKTVVLAFYGSYAEETDYAADHLGPVRGGPSAFAMVGPGETKTERLHYGLSRTIDTLEAAGKQVVLMIDVPELPFRPRDCITRPLQHAHTCAVDRKQALKRQALLRAVVQQVQAEHPALRVFDPLDAICGPERCEIRRGDMLVYRDSHHLSLRGSQVVADAFATWSGGSSLVAR